MFAFRIRWFIAVAAIALLAAASSANASTHASVSRQARAMRVPAMVPIPGHVLGALEQAKPLALKRGESKQEITVTIVLKHDDQAGVDRYIKDLNDPHSSNYHKYLSQEQIADRFGPSKGTYDETIRYLVGEGFNFVRGSKNRLTITVGGTRAQAEHAFGVTIGDYEAGKRKFYANDSDPQLPAELASRVLSVGGLTNYAQPQPERKALILAACVTIVGWFYGGLLGFDPNTANGKACILNALAQCLNSNFAAAGYDLPIVANFPCCNLLPGITTCGGVPMFSPGQSDTPESLLRAKDSSHGESVTPSPATTSLFTANGSGQTVGLVEFDNYNTSDVSDYLNLVGNPSTQISNLSESAVDGGTSIGSGEDEVLLDIDTVMSIAPGAKVVVYDAPFSGPGTSFQSVFNAAIDGGVSVISNSWAYCEDETTSADADSIDTIFQNAAMAHISIFNGSGDDGSSCLDGSANTISVPADSPNATAVGGSSLTPGPGYTYGSETWWDDSKTTPPAGQGGFGTSKFFPAASYQQTLTGSSMRTVPDVVANADPFHGSEICQADNGGCPNGKQYGGTSMAAPEWAGFTAVLNQAAGQNAGFFNPKLYSFANTAAFHNASALNSDVAHVGLGSPDLNAMFSMLSGISSGPVDAAASAVIGVLQNPLQPPGAPYPTGEPDDGSTAAIVRVSLADANGIAIANKNISLSGGASSAKITPSSAMSDQNGIATFQVTDETAESVTLTAKDTTDSVQLTNQLMVPFGNASATSAGLTAFPGTVPADGMTQADINIVLTDTLGRPAPGKFIQLSQSGGSSVISGPNPPVTDDTGTVKFTAVDSNNETIVYSAVDVTDGNLPFPQTGTVTFSDSPAAGCSNAQIAAPGFVAQPYATGLAAASFLFGDVEFVCQGAYGMAWDSSGNMYVSDQTDGNLYKIPPGGGVADSSTLVANIGVSLSGLVFDKSGNLYGTEMTTAGGFTTGSVFQINPSTGAVIRTVAPNLTCPEPLSIDPISGDLFTDDVCNGSGSNSPDVWRISNPASDSPTVSTYATLPSSPNANIGFAPDGTMYIWDDGQDVAVSPTSGPQPATVTPIATASNAPLGSSYIGVLAFGSKSGGGAQYLITNLPGNDGVTPNLPSTSNVVDLTTSPASLSTPLISSGGSQGMEVGPDGCVYMAQTNTVWRITDSNGNCTYTGTKTGTLSLSPATRAAPAAQGSRQTFSAMFNFTSVSNGTPVSLTVTGANPQTLQSMTTNNAATFSYTGAHQGVDTLIAASIAGSSTFNSNSATVTWGPGTDVTFLALNQSPSSVVAGQPVTLAANLSDASMTPVTAIEGQQVNFTLGALECQGSTDANGNATCEVTPNDAGTFTLSANFAGTSQFNPSSDSESFRVVPTPEIPQVPGKLKISPKKLNFGSVEVNSSREKSVKITNLGKVINTKKKHVTPDPITIEMESATTSSEPSPFTVTQCPANDQLGPKSKTEKAGTCTVMVTFAPTTEGKFTGTLKIMDNLESGDVTNVPLEGTGKAAK